MNEQQDLCVMYNPEHSETSSLYTVLPSVELLTHSFINDIKS